MTENNTAIEPANTTEIQPGFSEIGQGNYINTLDMESDKGRATFVKICNASESLNEHMGEVLNICDIVTTPGVRKGRNGMPDVPCQNTYLIDTDGKSYFSQSDGVARAVQFVAVGFPNLEYDGQNFVPIVCEGQELKNGNVMKTLVPAI